MIVTGDNLSSATAVDFGGSPAQSFSVNGNGTITAVSPGGDVATVDVTVVTLGGTTATSPADQFTYLAAPSVVSISPAAGPLSGGTAVTIVGTGLADATAVDFGGMAATSFTVNADGSITAVSPDIGSANTVDVTVVTTGGTSPPSLADLFTFAAQPSVASVSPTLGNTTGGDIVTITGANLDGATMVDFGPTTGTIIFDSPSEIQAVSPAGAVGSVHVSVVAPGGTSPTSSADQFLYVGAPSAMADNYSVNSGSTVTVNVPSGVLANDTDPQGDPLTADLLASTTNGTLSLGSDGSFTYAPNDRFVGTDSFIYQADNGIYVSTPTIVTITVASATLGDFNQDGHVDAGDVMPAMQALTNPSDYESQYGVSPADLPAIGDVNGDGHFNNADIQSLICLAANAAPSGGGSATGDAMSGELITASPASDDQNATTTSAVIAAPTDNIVSSVTIVPNLTAAFTPSASVQVASADVISPTSLARQPIVESTVAEPTEAAVSNIVSDKPAPSLLPIVLPHQAFARDLTLGELQPGFDVMLRSMPFNVPSTSREVSHLSGTPEPLSTVFLNRIDRLFSSDDTDLLPTPMGSLDTPRITEIDIHFSELDLVAGP